MIMLVNKMCISCILIVNKSIFHFIQSITELQLFSYTALNVTKNRFSRVRFDVFIFLVFTPKTGCMKEHYILIRGLSLTKFATVR